MWARNTIPWRSRGTKDKIKAFLNLLKPMGIKEIARTGAIALAREKQIEEEFNGKD